MTVSFYPIFIKGADTSGTAVIRHRVCVVTSIMSGKGVKCDPVLAYIRNKM